MAVAAVWQCDRDGAMFDNKKEAEEHDKMLELAANITCLIEKHVNIDEKSSEAIGLLLAERREILAKACKGKPETLLETHSELTSKLREKVSDDEKQDKIAKIAVNQ